MGGKFVWESCYVREHSFQCLPYQLKGGGGGGGGRKSLNRMTNCFLQIANGQKQLKDIEDRILQMLANSQGNILDDEVIPRLLISNDWPASPRKGGVLWLAIITFLLFQALFLSALIISYLSPFSWSAGSHCHISCKQDNVTWHKWPISTGLLCSLSLGLSRPRDTADYPVGRPLRPRPRLMPLVKGPCPCRLAIIWLKIHALV